VGGETELQRPHPFVVSLQHRNRHFCGGSLLDDQHVLTAAHCGENVRCSGDICEGVDVHVRRWNLTIYAEDEFPGCSEMIRGEKFVPHPEYKGSPSYVHDLAILKLARPISRIGQACAAYGLPRYAATAVQLDIRGSRNAARITPGIDLEAVGWGRMWSDGHSRGWHQGATGFS
jgi:hypothetical protein